MAFSALILKFKYVLIGKKYQSKYKNDKVTDLRSSDTEVIFSY